MDLLDSCLSLLIQDLFFGSYLSSAPLIEFRLITFDPKTVFDIKLILRPPFEGGFESNSTKMWKLIASWISPSTKWQSQMRRNPSQARAKYAEPTGEWPEVSSNYKASKFSRKFELWKIGIWLPRRQYKDRSVLFIPGSKCIKFGPRVHLAEADALRLVAKHTSVPVPKVYHAFEENGISVIVMEKIKGELLGNIWNTMSAKDRETVIHQLKGYFDQLRKIPHPRPGTICSANQGSLFDPRILDGELGFGPFEKQEDFNLFLRGGSQKESVPAGFPEVAKFIDMQARKHHSVCFTHGDAHCFNIMVRKKWFGKLEAVLIDFETAGFYPDYWEYVTAMDVRKDTLFWKNEVGKFLQEYPIELEMDQIRLKFFSNRGVIGIH